MDASIVFLSTFLVTILCKCKQRVHSKSRTFPLYVSKFHTEAASYWKSLRWSSVCTPHVTVRTLWRQLQSKAESVRFGTQPRRSSRVPFTNQETPPTVRESPDVFLNLSCYFVSLHSPFFRSPSPSDHSKGRKTLILALVCKFPVLCELFL